MARLNALAAWLATVALEVLAGACPAVLYPAAVALEGLWEVDGCTGAVSSAAAAAASRCAISSASEVFGRTV